MSAEEDAMSMSARREIRLNTHFCDCGKRALYLRPGGGGVRYRRDHPLCRRCWRSLRVFGRPRPRRPSACPSTPDTSPRERTP